MQAWVLDEAVEDIGDLEGAELETIDLGPQHSEHRRRRLCQRRQRARSC
jgi:hypothetical protein